MSPARDVRETARKLRRLTTSPNAAEAAAARRKYREFTARHRISVEDEPLFPPSELDDWTALAQRVAAIWEMSDDDVRRLVAETERVEVEYLRRLPLKSRDAKLRQLEPMKRFRYQCEIERLRQASRAKRRKRG